MKNAYLWARANLFSSPANAAMTVAMLALLALIVPPAARFLVIDAVFAGDSREACLAGGGLCWPYIRAKWAGWIYGSYPLELRWRADLALAGLALGVAYLIVPRTPRKKIAGALMLSVYPIVAFILLHGAGGDGALRVVETPLWGGFMLTLVVALTGIVASLPIGVVLALARRAENLPAIRMLAICFIEFVRGVPLIMVLFMASVMLPLFMPPGADIDKLLRALIGVALFAAAYMAEVVRGGLQAIGRGQTEAANALGLGYWKTMRLIVLPQALKISIPGIVNSFISLFKDTTLVLIIGLFDLLGKVQQTNRDLEWATPATAISGYIVAAAMFWICCYGMSRYSRGLEKKFDAGRKRQAA